MSGDDHQHDHDGHDHGHAHGAGGHHHHQPPAGFDGAFALGAALNAGFVAAEVVFGIAIAARNNGRFGARFMVRLRANSVRRMAAPDANWLRRSAQSVRRTQIDVAGTQAH